MMLKTRKSSFRKVLASAMTLTSLSGCASTATAQDGQTADTTQVVELPQTTLQRHYRGTLECTAEDGSNCGAEYWSMFLHVDGSRVLQIASETARAGEVRHAMIVVGADEGIDEAFMHNRSRADALGSTFVLQSDDGVDQAIHNNTGLTPESQGIEVSSVENEVLQNDRTIGTGPVSADGLHFLGYDVEQAGDQPNQVFWMGGTFGGTMAGVYRQSSYSLIGEEAIAMPQGYEIMTDHFRMSSGTEIWLTKDSRIVVRADVRFGPSPVLRYQLRELEVTVLGGQ